MSNYKIRKIGHTADLIFNDATRHHATRFFGKEVDDFVLAIFAVLENRRNHLSVRFFWFHRFKVFVRGQVNQHIVALFGNRL